MGLFGFTDLDAYYDDPSKWGEHQYTPLTEVVNNFMFEQSDDSFVAHADRNRVVLFAKKGLRELYLDTLNEVIAIELDLNPDTLTIALPHDYVSYVRISWVDANGRLHPMAVDRTYNLAQAYLQDVDYSFLYDEDTGAILQASHRQNKTTSTYFSDEEVPTAFTPFLDTKNYNTDRSKIHKNGAFQIDKERGVIQFSSEATGKTIVLEYISDGLYQRTDADLKVHKFAEPALYAYVYYNFIKRSRTAPLGEKARAEKEWWNSRRRARKHLAGLTADNIRQALLGGSRTIKD